MRRVRLLASGTVQGVYFRASAADRAAVLGVTGWVRNTPDGRVEAEAQGGPGSVADFVEFCRDGPGHAVITSLEVTEVEPVDGESRFEVRP